MEITEKIKSFEDACHALGIETEEQLPALLQSKYADIVPSHIKAEMKLEIITKALNEGWSHFPDGKHFAYWPWFGFYTVEEIAKHSGAWAKEYSIIDATDVSDVFAGLGYAHSYIAWSYSHATFGSRLAYKSSALAKYSGRQFVELWKEYLLIPIIR